METIFTHGNVTLRKIETRDMIMREASINHGDWSELVSVTDPRVQNAIMALLKTKQI